MIKSYLSCCVYWLENLHRLYWDRISALSRIIQEITVITDIKCQSVKSVGFHLIIFREGKEMFTLSSAAEPCCYFKYKCSKNRKPLLLQFEIVLPLLQKRYAYC
jgi:hypothetical protein